MKFSQLDNAAFAILSIEQSKHKQNDLQSNGVLAVLLGKENRKQMRNKDDHDDSLTQWIL